MTETLELTPAELKADMDLMDEAAAELSRITERTEFTLSVLTQAIRTQEAIAKGKVLIQLRDRIPDGEWQKFLNREDVRLSYQSALLYINAAQLIEDAGPLYGEEMLMNFGVNALSGINKLPTDAKLSLLDKAEETGNPIKLPEVTKLSDKTETKLSKSAERLADAKEKKQKASEKYEQVKADPNIKATDADYIKAATNNRNADQSIEKLEARILQLESELEKEHVQKAEINDTLTERDDDLSVANRKLTEAQDSLAKAIEEAHKLRFDGDTARQQRVARVGNQLILTLPQVLADIQKFVADREGFEEKISNSVTNQINVLKSYLNEHFYNPETEQESES